MMGIRAAPQFHRSKTNSFFGRSAASFSPCEAMVSLNLGAVMFGKMPGKNSRSVLCWAGRASGAEAHIDSVGFVRGLKPPPPSEPYAPVPSESSFIAFSKPATLSCHCGPTEVVPLLKNLRSDAGNRVLQQPLKRSTILGDLRHR